MVENVRQGDPAELTLKVLGEALLAPTTIRPAECRRTAVNNMMDIDGGGAWDSYDLHPHAEDIRDTIATESSTRTTAIRTARTRATSTRTASPMRSGAATVADRSDAA